MFIKLTMSMYDEVHEQQYYHVVYVMACRLRCNGYPQTGLVVIQ